MCGVYPAADALDAGTEISSTYEGRHLTFLENELIHPSHSPDLVHKGDPVIVGENIVGVAFESAIASGQLIAIDTEGIWVLSVTAVDNSGNVAVDAGDQLFINIVTRAISKNASPEVSIPFGYALGAVPSSYTRTIAVKVHWDPAQAFKYYCGATAYNEIRGYLAGTTPMQVFKCSGDQYRAVFQAINDANDSDYFQLMSLDGSRTQAIWKATYQIEMVDYSAGNGAGAWLLTRSAEPSWVGAATPANMRIASPGTGIILVSDDDANQTVLMRYDHSENKVIFRNLDGKVNEVLLA